MLVTRTSVRESVFLMVLNITPATTRKSDVRPELLA